MGVRGVGTRTAAVLVAAVIGCGVAGAGTSAADPDTPAPPPGPVSPAQHGAAEAADPTAPSAAPSTAPPADSPPAPGPVAMDHDGTFAVGTQILPGVYSSAGPLDGGTCYWRRIGPDNTTLENALSKQPQVVQIDAGDVAFKTNGCQPWQLTNQAPPNQNPPWLSQLQLRHNLDILNGLAGQSGNGQLPPY